MLVFVLLLLDTVADTEQAVQVLIGATTTAICAREPDCRVGIWQTRALLLGALQVPEFAVALLSVTPCGNRGVHLDIRGGVWPFVGDRKGRRDLLPAPSSPRIERTGSTQVMHNWAAVPNWTTKALRVP